MTVGTWIVSQIIFLALADNNGEVRHHNVFSWNPISTRGIPRAKLRPPTYTMSIRWNEVHRGIASKLSKQSAEKFQGWPGWIKLWFCWKTVKMISILWFTQAPIYRCGKTLSRPGETLLYEKIFYIHNGLSLCFMQRKDTVYKNKTQRCKRMNRKRKDIPC